MAGAAVLVSDFHQRQAAFQTRITAEIALCEKAPGVRAEDRGAAESASAMPLSSEAREKIEKRLKILHAALKVSQQETLFSSDPSDALTGIFTSLKTELESHNPHRIRTAICNLLGYAVAVIAIGPATLYPFEVPELPAWLKIASGAGTGATYGILAGSFLTDTFDKIAADPLKATKVFFGHLLTLGTYARWQHQGREPAFAKFLLGLGFTVLDVGCLATFFTPYTQADQMSEFLPAWWVPAAKVFALNAPNTNLRLGHGIVHGAIDWFLSTVENNQARLRTLALIRILKAEIYHIAQKRPDLLLELQTQLREGSLAEGEKLQLMANCLTKYRASQPDYAGKTLAEELSQTTSRAGEYSLNFFCILMGLLSSIPGALIASNTNPPEALRVVAHYCGIPERLIGAVLGYAAYVGNIPLSCASGLTLARHLGDLYRTKGAGFFDNYSGLWNWAGAAFGVADIGALIASNIGQLVRNPLPLAGGSLNGEFMIVSSAALVGLGLLTGSAAGQRVAEVFNEHAANRAHLKLLAGEQLTPAEKRLVAKKVAGELTGTLDKLEVDVSRVPVVTFNAKFVPTIVSVSCAASLAGADEGALSDDEEAGSGEGDRPAETDALLGGASKPAAPSRLQSCVAWCSSWLAAKPVERLTAEDLTSAATRAVNPYAL